MKVQIEDRRKYLKADEGMLIYFIGVPIEEQVGVDTICIPIEWDEDAMYTEIPNTAVPGEVNESDFVEIKIEVEEINE